MRILRLTNSNDFDDRVPEPLRGATIFRELVAVAIGEPVEMTVRPFWPSPDLPGIAGRWLERYEPDVVLVRCAAYWVSFESVPLRVERAFGRLGAPVATLGRRIGSNQSVATNPIAVGVRKMMVRGIGGDTYFTPQAAADHVEALLRAVLVHEAVVPVVRGPGLPHNSAGSGRGLRLALQRNREFDDLLHALCERLQVAWVGVRRDSADGLARDDVHSTAEVSRAFAEVEAAAVAEAWLAAGGGRARRD